MLKINKKDCFFYFFNFIEWIHHSLSTFQFFDKFFQEIIERRQSREEFGIFVATLFVFSRGIESNLRPPRIIFKPSYDVPMHLWFFNAQRNMGDLNGITVVVPHGIFNYQGGVKYCLKSIFITIREFSLVLMFVDTKPWHFKVVFTFNVDKFRIEKYRRPSFFVFRVYFAHLEKNLFFLRYSSSCCVCQKKKLK